MATADLITAFLGNEMSPEAERQFLLSVAASDALRLELKSHLMLDRMMGERARRAHVPDAVRMAIFAQAGVAATAAAPSAQSAPIDRAPAPRPGFFSRLSGRVTLAAAALAFFGVGYAAGTGADDETRAAQSPPSAVVAPMTQSPVERRVAPSPAPTNAASSDVMAAEEVAASRTAPRIAEPRRSDDERSSSPTRASGSSVILNNTPTTDVPATTTSEPKVDEPFRASRHRSVQPVQIDGTIRSSTEEERNRSSNPLEGEAEKNMR